MLMFLPKYTNLQVSPNLQSDVRRVRPSRHDSMNVGKHLIKTKVCSLFIKGRCHYGYDRCFYAHSVEELREQPKLEKTSLCPAFRKGNCFRGENCKYAHSVDEMTKSACRVMCIWYKEGFCSHGTTCRFSHGEKCETPSTSWTGNAVEPPTDISRHEQSADRSLSSLSMSPSSTRTFGSPLLAGHRTFPKSFDELDSAASMHSHAFTGLSILELLSSPQESYPVIPFPRKAGGSGKMCGKCCSSIGCICQVFEDCSNLLRLL